MSLAAGQAATAFQSAQRTAELRRSQAYLTEAQRLTQNGSFAMAGFAELLDTAIANADSRGQLIASRTRLLAAGDDARRRVVGICTTAPSSGSCTRSSRSSRRGGAFHEDSSDAETLLAEALETVEQATAEVRELAHARPTRATVRATLDDGVLTLNVRDDGVGGADPAGHGLVDISDRDDALGGRLRIDSAEGVGTAVTARLPLSTRWPPGRASNARETDELVQERRELSASNGRADAGSAHQGALASELNRVPVV